jgi:hypothetical protein
MDTSLEIIYAVLIFVVFVAFVLRIALYVFEDKFVEEQDQEKKQMSNIFDNN